MKQLVTTILFLVILVSSMMANGLEPIKINSDSLRSGKDFGITNWYYLEGDDSTNGRKLEIDSTWLVVNSLDIIDSNKTAKWNGRAWFKRELEIDSANFGTPALMSLTHFGASQIYLNGKLIKKYGKLKEGTEEFYHPQGIPFVFQLPDTSIITLAVRFSNYLSINDSTWYNKKIEQKGFTLRIHDVDKKILSVVEIRTLTAALNVGLFGLFLSLGLLYLLLFAFYSRNLENLYYSIFTLSLGFAIFLGFLKNLIHENIKLIVLFETIPGILLAFVFLFYVLFLYRIFYAGIPKQGWIFIGITILIAVLFAFGSQSDFLGYLFFGFIFVIAIEGIRVIIVALKNKKDNVWIIGTGVLFFGAFIFFLFAINVLELRIHQYLGMAMLFTGVFSLPISMSIYLARQIADTNKHLELQIGVVQELSERELENQKKHAELKLQHEKEAASAKESELRAVAAELQAKVIQAENDRKTKELEEARELQISMLPKEIPQLPNLEIAVYMETATEVGGDYYDFHVADDGILTVVIGDATGHGLNAGTMVTVTKSLFKSHADNNDILATFREISRVIKGMKFRLLSMCLCMLKINGNQLTISSAGIPPTLIYRVESDTIEEFLIRGMPLGVKKDFPYEIRKTEIAKGDTILLMSDGFPELFNAEKEMLDYPKVKEIFHEAATKNSEEIISHLKNSVRNWAGNKAPDDDITFVVIKVK